MDILDLIKKIKDVDEYTEDPVSSEEMSHILEAVRWTISAGNTQPWEVFVVRDEGTKKALDNCILDSMLRTKDTDDRISKAPVAIILGINRKRARARYGNIGEDYYSVQDIGAAVNNMRLAAIEKGIHSCWIREVNLKDISKALKLYNFIRPMALVTMGYSNQRVEAPPLLEAKYWTHIEKEQ